jgi:hypothetical protein
VLAWLLWPELVDDVLAEPLALNEPLAEPAAVVPAPAL